MRDRPTHIGKHLYSLEALCGVDVGDEYSDTPMVYDVSDPKTRYCKRCLRALAKTEPATVAALEEARGDAE